MAGKKVATKKQNTKKVARKVVESVTQVVGRNVSVTSSGTKLLIEIDTAVDLGLTQGAVAKGGDNHMIASTGRAVRVPIGDGKFGMLGLNLYSNQIGK